MAFKLGKKPARPGAIRLKFSEIVDATALPTPPASFGHQRMIGSHKWGMLGNDQYGDCVFAGAAHEEMLWSREGKHGNTIFDDRCVLSDYAAATGFDPNDPNTDQGADMVEAASYRRKIGIVDEAGVRHKIDAYAEIARADLSQVALATWLFGACGIGVEWPASAFDQFDAGKPLDVVDGDEILGGHYMPCLSGDTKISLLNGTEVPIGILAQLGRDQWIYALDDKGRVVPALATDIRRTGRNRKLVRVHLDDGNSFDCTPDHLIMLRNGTYHEAGKLLPGMSLMPLYRKYDKYGYEEFFEPRDESWKLTHRRVAGEDNEIGKDDAVHHIDFVKTNNMPGNLQVMTWDDHTKLHADNPVILNNYAKSTDGRERSRKLMKANWADPEFVARHQDHLRTNPKLAEHRKRDNVPKEVRSANGKLTGAKNLKNADKSAAAKAAHASIRERMERDPVYRERIQKGRLIGLSKMNGLKNHKVLAIEKLPGRHDVYDLEVPVRHNFAVSAGVFVHNCIGRHKDGHYVLVTWGQMQLATSRWMRTYMDEAVAYLSRDVIINKMQTTDEGFDLAKLDAFLKSL